MNKRLRCLERIIRTRVDKRVPYVIVYRSKEQLEKVLKSEQKAIARASRLYVIPAFAQAQSIGGRSTKKEH